MGEQLAVGIPQPVEAEATHFFMRGQQYPWAHCSEKRHGWHLPKLFFATQSPDGDGGDGDGRGAGGGGEGDGALQKPHVFLQERFMKFL